MKKAIEEMEMAIRKLEEESGDKYNFFVVIQCDDGKHHVQQVRVDASDDHHFLDMVSALHENWWKSNHLSLQ